MKNLQPSPSTSSITEAADDFTRIHGIGPGIERRLHTAGIRTYAQLAQQTPKQLALVLKGLAAMQEDWIDAQDWVGQAGKLAVESAESEEANEIRTTKPVEVRQHYENFTLEFLLDEINQVRRTRVIHIQTQAENSWPGWEETRLLDYLKENAGISTRQALGEATMPSEPEEKVSDLPARPRGEPTERPRLVDLEAFEPGNNLATHHLRAGEPFNLRLNLDLAGMMVSPQAPITYLATIYAQGVGGSQNQIVGTAQGCATTPRSEMISITDARLPAGHYRLEAVSRFTLDTATSHGEREMMAYLEGGLYQFF